MAPTEAVSLTVFNDLIAKCNSESSFAPQAPGERDDTFLRRLAGATSSLQDQNWKALQVVTQDWYNEAAKAINAMQPLASPAGFVSNYVGQPDPPAPVVVVPAAASTGTAKPRAGKGLMNHSREVALAHLDWTSDQIGDFMRTEGWDVPKTDSVWLATCEVKNVLKALDAIGMKIVAK